MEYPLVSVVIPIYNMQQFLADTIESVLNSSYANFEVILMDDGSTDNSVQIAKSYAEQNARIKFFSQPNGGASSARNHAISLAQGEYILPVDADNLITSEYIHKAVNILQANDNVKVVSCEAIFIGERSGVWKFPEFSIRLLARKNLIDNCAMYRKSDWVKCGGYCQEIRGREDWDFWISLLKTGGDFCRLPFVGLYYRVRKNSKKAATRHLKGELIAQLNSRHKPFFYKQLNGKIHFNRSWSTFLNAIKQLLAPEKIHVSTRFNALENLVYYLPETNPRQSETARRKVLFNSNEIEILWFKEYFRCGKSKAIIHFEHSNPATRIGYYEKRNLWGCRECFVAELKGTSPIPKASLIIAVYKNVFFLKAVLESVQSQTEQDFEIIIAEDGENAEMKNFIETYPFSHKHLHITQADEGWRKNKCLNKAVRAATSDWLIFIDGDCVLHPRFVEMHLMMADENSILAGKRVKLDEQTSSLLLGEKINAESIQHSLFGKLIIGKGKIKFLEEGIYIAPDGIFGFIPKIRKINKLKGCNMSFSKNAILAINGFDEDYQLPAIGEDIDLTWRFNAAGFKHISIRNLAVQYHLHHPEGWVEQKENAAMMQDKQSRNEYVCKNGLTKHDIRK